MPRQRFADCASKSLSFRMTNECLSISCFVSGRGRLIGNDSGFFARQNFFTGQIPHFGLRERQTSAPRSTKAELYAAEDFLGTNEAAYSQRLFWPDAESIGIRKLNRRENR